MSTRRPACPGRMRDYERGDRELAARWMDAFAEEALPEPPPGTSEEFVDRREEDPDGGIVLWEDGGAVVSMAGFGGRTPNGIRIGPGLHAARAARPRLRERAHRRGDAAAARRRPALLLPLHRPRQPDLEQHLPADRLRAGQRLRPLDVLGVGCAAASSRNRGGNQMRKASLFVALAAALVFAAAGSAITNGEPDGNAHPEVGALLATQAFPDGTWEECTGTLISAHVFLTAEHCDLGVDRVEVTFATRLHARREPHLLGHVARRSRATARRRAIPHDLAVVVLDDDVAPLEGITPARLPGGRLALEPAERPAVHSGRLRRAVGHERRGRQDVPLPGRPLPDGRDAQHGHAGLAEDLRQPVARRRQHVLRRLRRPELPRRRLSETNIIAGTTITGDTPCRSTNVDYRLDTPSARAFLGQFVTLP